MGLLHYLLKTLKTTGVPSWGGIVAFFFLSFSNSFNLYAQAPDEMMIQPQQKDTTIISTTKTGDDSKKDVGVQVVGEEEIDKIQIGINTFTQLINLQETKLLRIAKESVNLNQSSPELKQLQEDRKSILSRIEGYEVKLEELNEQQKY